MACTACGGGTPIPSPAPPDANGRTWAWCLNHGDRLVCWPATVDIPRTALAYVALHGLRNPRRTIVTPDAPGIDWPEGAPT